MNEEVANKELKVCIGGNYYGNLAINSIFERLVTGFSDYTEEKEITGDFTQTMFKSAYADAYINARMIYSLLVYGYLVEKTVEIDDMDYQVKLFQATKEQMETRKVSVENLSGVKWENENEKKLWKRLVNLFPESMAMYGMIVKKTSETERDEIIKRIVEKYNSSHSKEIDILIRDGSKNIEEKVKELFEKMDDIFVNSINSALEYNLEKFDIKSCFLLMLKDAFTLIALQLIFEGSPVIARKNMVFYGNKWYIYFIMVLFDEYRKTGANLLRMKKNPAFLNYGATIKETGKILRNFFEKRKPRRGDSSPLENYPELPHRLFFFLLGYGTSRRESYVEASLRNMKGSEKAIFEFKIDDVINEEMPEKSFSALLSVTNFRIRRIAQMLALSEYSSKAVDDFETMFVDARRDFEDNDETSLDIESALKEVIASAGPEITDDWDALKNICLQATKNQQRKILNELVAEILFRSKTGRETISERVKNLKELLKPFLSSSNTAVQRNTLVSLGNRVFIEHNFFSEERAKAQNDLENFRKSNLKKFSEINRNFPKLITSLEAIKFRTSLRELAEKRLLERARKRIVINSGFDFEDGNHPVERYSVYSHIYYIMATYVKIFENDDLGMGTFIKAMDSVHYSKLFHSLVCDTAAMITAKEEGKFIAENIIIEYDYLPEIMKKVEKYFNFFLLDEKELEKIPLEEKKEAEDVLLLVSTALKTAFSFYTDPYLYLSPKLSPRRSSENAENEIYTETEIFLEVMNCIDPEEIFNI